MRDGPPSTWPQLSEQVKWLWYYGEDCLKAAINQEKIASTFLKMKFHPLAQIFPLLPESELLELAEDIKQNGLLFPITLYEDKILDVRNRYLACKKAKVEPKLLSKHQQRREKNESINH